MKKKFTLLMIIAIISISFISCTNNNNKNNAENQNNNQQTDITKPDNTDINNKDIQVDTNPSKIESKPETKNIRLFFFNTERMHIEYVEKTVTIVDNALVSALTKAHQSYDDDKMLLTLTDNVAVTSANLKDGILHVYLNDDFTKYMQLGSSTEGGLISSLVCTYGYNYKVNKVAIYCNNELYTGLRGDLPKGYYEVDCSQAVPYKR